MTAGVVQRALSSLRDPPCDYIGEAARVIPGDSLRSHYPAQPASIVWSGAPDVAHVDEVVAAARAALPAWAGASRERRFAALRAYQALLREREDGFTNLICAETGKPLWEARQEAQALAAKVDITLETGPHAGLSRVEPFDVSISDTRIGRTTFRPHGVMAVVGPFNFPAHLPNGHIVPALAMGDCVVLKPSDKTPAVGQLLAQTLRDALEREGISRSVVSLVQGGADIASRLVAHPGIDGVLFTGSWPVGRKILEANLDRPGRIIALEMGGNNAAVVLSDANLKQAVMECCRASFATAGQRCTCTRRIIVEEDIADRFLRAFVQCARSLRVGDPTADEPVFMGPIIRAAARDAALAFARQAADAGAEVLLEPRALNDVKNCPGGHFVSPGVLRVERFVASDAGGPGRDAGCDVEIFGPLARVCVARDLDEAIEQANATRYGLAASIFTTSERAQRRFLAEARAGCVNVNTGTAGASSKLPFGGLGLSGNHRPAAAFSLDYCAYPVASLIETGETAAASPGMAFDEAWISR